MQYAKVYLRYTPLGGPPGERTLTPLRLYPDGANRATLTWPVVQPGTYEFCLQTFSLSGKTNGELVCQSIVVAEIPVSPSASVSPSSSVSPSASESASPSPTPSASVSPSSSESASPSAAEGPPATGLLRDYDADHYTPTRTDGQRINSAWENEVSPGTGDLAHSASTGCTAIYRASQANGLPALEFGDATATGSGCSFGQHNGLTGMALSAAASSNSHIFLVIRRTATGFQHHLLTTGGGANGIEVAIRSSDNKLVLRRPDSTELLVASVAVSTANYELWAVSYDHAAHEATIRRNAAADASVSGLSNFTFSDGFGAICRQRFNNGGHYRGRLARLLVYSGVQTGSALSDIENYLMTTYGL